MELAVLWWNRRGGREREREREREGGGGGREERNVKAMQHCEASSCLLFGLTKDLSCVSCRHHGRRS